MYPNSKEKVLSILLRLETNLLPQPKSEGNVFISVVMLFVGIHVR